MHSMQEERKQHHTRMCMRCTHCRAWATACIRFVFGNVCLVCSVRQRLKSLLPPPAASSSSSAEGAGTDTSVQRSERMHGSCSPPPPALLLVCVAACGGVSVRGSARVQQRGEGAGRKGKDSRRLHAPFLATHSSIQETQHRLGLCYIVCASAHICCYLGYSGAERIKRAASGFESGSGIPLKGRNSKIVD